MGEIGDTLREQRISAKIDVQQIEESTKIRAKYLRALENEEFDLLPGPAYVKSFLRTYADTLGLDGRHLVDVYRHDYEPREESDLSIFPGRTPIGADGVRSGPRWGRVLLVLVVLALVALLAIGLLSSDSAGASALLSVSGA